MPVPTTITDLSTTAASNYPQGTDSPSTLDDTQRAHGAFIRQLQTGAVTTTANVTAGTINGATVGATTPSTGAFTTLSASGKIDANSVGTNIRVKADGTDAKDNIVACLSNGNMYLGNWLSPSLRLDNGAAANTAVISSTGLAVTGALSATGSVSSSNSTTAIVTAVGGTGAGYGGYFGAQGQGAWSGYFGSYSAISGTGTDNSLAIWAAGASNSIKFITNSVLQATLDTSGNIGLGVTPSEKLDVLGNARIQQGNYTDAVLRISQSAITSGNVSQILFQDQLTNTTASITAYGSAFGSGNNYALAFATNGAERARIDSSGNLGLGVTPSAWGGGYKALEFGGGGSSLFSGTSTASQTYLTANSYFNGTNWIYKNTNPASNYEQLSGKHTWYTAPSGTAGTAITFTQAMTLDASGNLLVNTTTTSATNTNSIQLQPGTAGASAYISHASGSLSGSVYAGFLYNAVLIGSITQNGTTAVAYNLTSDHRLKLNVRPADALKFMDIQFRDFEWVDGRHDCGVIAHELQAVYPDLVLGEKDATEVRTVEITPAVPEVKDEEGNVVTPAVPAVTEQQTFPVYQQVNYIGLICRMGTRIQQQQRLIEAQAAALAAIEARLAAAGIA